MDIQILECLEGARSAQGLTVIIDVFRAMTVEAYVMNNGAAELIPMADLSEAYEYRKTHPEVILIGERNGKKCEGFDFGNSPSAVKNFDFSGKTVIHTTSAGNAYAHAILRGYIDYSGRSTSNYHYEDLLRVEELYAMSNLTNPSIIVDTNHNNSGKKYLEQVRIAKDIVYSRNQNGDIKRLVKGLMIESYLEDGACKPEEHIFGKSITDPCLGWEKTEKLIFDIADKL